MDTCNNLKKGTKIGLIVMAVLICIGIVNLVLSFFIPADHNNPNVIAQLIIGAVMYASIIVYAFFGYKKAHGNMLRTVFFVFGVFIVASGIIGDPGLSEIHIKVCQFTTGFAALLIGYIAGRLDRIEKNKILMMIAGVLMLIGRVIVFVSDPSSIWRFVGVMEHLIVWASLGFAYVARYEEHKTAGLSDADA